jgi:hypothetical protein
MGFNPFFARIGISFGNRFNDHIVVVFSLQIILVSEIGNQTETDDEPNPHPGFDEILVF